MITCPKCSAQNDPSNRFCDQCGFRLEGAANSPAAADATVAAPAAPATDTTTPAMKCPSCGADVLPGEAFCDVCGAALQPVAAPVSANDLPTVIATPAGGTNAVSETAANPNDVPTAATPTIPPTPPQSSAAPAPTSAPAAASTPSGQEYDAEKQRLEEVIATQDKLITQMEQLQSTFGAATPPAILDGLKQAREAKAKAESDLQALPPPKPAVDPAEVARLEEQIATQDKLIAQMEQLQTTFGAATPPAILDGLKQAREAKTKAESDLQALTDGVPPAPLPSQIPTKTDIAPVPGPATPPPSQAAPPPPSQAAPSAAPAPSGPAAEDDTLPPPALSPVPPPPTPAPVAQGPRLVFADGGKDVLLPLDKAEIIVGREDPISQIFPEIDLTPFGGETGGVSRQHAKITQSNGQWLLTDLNSTNYTRIDGVKIDPQVPVTMRDGARVQFGRIAAVFHV